jgi:aryl carrier-like protein
MSRGYQLRAASRASGYSMIRPRQGLCSLLAGLARGERDLVVGLDAGRPNVRRHLVAPPAPAERLAGYVAYPGALAVSGDVLDRFGTRSRCDVFALDALPLTEAGELDRAFLEAAGNGGRAASADRVLPRSDLERTIAAAWREVLGIEVVDVHTSFFTLGGQSILLIQLLSKLKRSTGRDLTVVDLFRHPTVSALAAHLGTAAPGRPTYARAAERAKKQQEAARQRVSPRGERTGHR